MQGITQITLATAPKATNTYSIKQCLFLTIINKTMAAGSWAWRDQPIDQTRPILTSRLHELRGKVVYCQWQYTRVQISTMTQPPGSHHPLHGSHKVPHTRSCVGISHSQIECSPRWGSQTRRGDVNLVPTNPLADDLASMSPRPVYVCWLCTQF